MKALTIDAYWAWAIAHAGKRIENRTRRTHYRGPLAIHAAKTAGPLARNLLGDLGWWPPVDVPCGVIIATCELLDCVELGPTLTTARGYRAWPEVARSPFAWGPWCWLLADITPLVEPIPCRGQQYLWDVPATILASMDLPARNQLGGSRERINAGGVCDNCGLPRLAHAEGQCLSEAQAAALNPRIEAWFAIVRPARELYQIAKKRAKSKRTPDPAAAVKADEAYAGYLTAIRRADREC